MCDSYKMKNITIRYYKEKIVWPLLLINWRSDDLKNPSFRPKQVNPKGSYFPNWFFLQHIDSAGLQLLSVTLKTQCDPFYG